MVNRVLAAVALTCGCIAIPPSRASYGPAVGARGAGYRASIGAHSLAADKDDETDVDLGAGWVGEGGRQRDAVHGTYLAVAHRLSALDGRLWIGGRAETFWRVTAPDEPRHGLVVRVALRHRLGGIAGGTSSRGDAAGAYGAFALGLHAELGARSLVGGGSELLFALGGSLDLPFVIATGSPRWY
jgi:hypothetical protein